MKYWIYCGPHGSYKYQETKEFETEREACNYALEKACDSYTGLSREDVWKEISNDLGPFDRIDEDYVDDVYLECVRESMSYTAVIAIPGHDPKEFERYTK